MKELIIAFGLFLFIEGILYAVFPTKMKNMLKKLTPEFQAAKKAYEKLKGVKI